MEWDVYMANYNIATFTRLLNDIHRNMIGNLDRS